VFNDFLGINATERRIFNDFLCCALDRRIINDSVSWGLCINATERRIFTDRFMPGHNHIPSSVDFPQTPTKELLLEPARRKPAALRPEYETVFLLCPTLLFHRFAIATHRP
jgi:hypothetical protein